MNIIESFIKLFQHEFYLTIYSYFVAFAPIWVPFILFGFFMSLWLRLKRIEYNAKQGSILLEIKAPKEIMKSPMAMELFLSSFVQGGVGNYLDVYLSGRVRPWFSLELVSLDGEVHLYIWTQPKFKSIIETQLYAQYPNIEIHEVSDYALNFHYNPETHTIGWAGQFAFTKPDAYPIKTYIDYGLDKDPKEEFKHDPIVPLIEFLGSLKRGEQAWIQILIQAHRKEDLKDVRIVKKPDWKEAAKKEIQKIMKEGGAKSEDSVPSVGNLTQLQKETLNAIERTLNKFAFDTMIRATYIATKESFDGTNIGGLLGSFRQFGSNNLNGFKPSWNTGYDYPWQDFKGRRKARNNKLFIDAYKRRSFFNYPYKNFHGRPFIMSTEELATIFHIPGEVSGTPTFTRIPSKKSEAPSNLPI